MSSRFDIDRTHHIRVLRKATLNALKTSLRLAVVGADMLTDWARLTGVMRWHGQHFSAPECLLVGQLSPEFVPTLIQYRPVQAGFCGNICARIFRGAFGRARHIADLQILNHDHCVVFADRGRGFVKGVSPDIGDAGVNPVYAGFLFLPVGREFHLAGQSALRSGQGFLVFLKGAGRLDERSVRQRDEPGNSDIDADHGSGRMLRVFDLTLSLEADKPVATVESDGAVFDGAEDFARLAKCDPAKPGRQLYSPPFQLAVFVKIHEADAVARTALLLEARALCVTHFLEIPLPGGIQVFEFLLEVVGVGFFEPLRFSVFFPARHPLRHRLVARNELTFGLSRFIAQCQRLIPHKPSMTAQHPQARRSIISNL